MLTAPTSHRGDLRLLLPSLNSGEDRSLLLHYGPLARGHSATDTPQRERLGWHGLKYDTPEGQVTSHHAALTLGTPPAKVVGTPGLRSSP
jgi:hypothetical protein